MSDLTIYGVTVTVGVLLLIGLAYCTFEPEIRRFIRSITR